LDNVEIPSLQMVNPDDIESISVLKDAASAAIYGAKAAFGVILITSKKGAKTESVNVTYSGNVAFQNQAKNFDIAGVDGLHYVVEAAERMGKLSTEDMQRIKSLCKHYNLPTELSEPIAKLLKATRKDKKREETINIQAEAIKRALSGLIGSKVN
jgi:TonB-dependent SusC/RagA subfamily outer membrane receptor